MRDALILSFFTHLNQSSSFFGNLFNVDPINRNKVIKELLCKPLLWSPFFNFNYIFEYLNCLVIR